MENITSNNAFAILRCWYMERSDAPCNTPALARVNQMCKVDTDTILEAWPSQNNACTSSLSYGNRFLIAVTAPRFPAPMQQTHRCCGQLSGNTGFMGPALAQGPQSPRQRVKELGACRGVSVDVLTFLLLNLITFLCNLLRFVFAFC